MSTDEIERDVALLREAFAGFPADPGATSRCVELLDTLKESLMRNRIQNKATSVKFWLLAREVYEIGALVSIYNGGESYFEYFYSQLHPIYFDYTKVIERSERMERILGVRLFHLLTENRIGDFYMMLELIPQDIRDSTNINYIVDLERSMMEGNLARLIDANHTAPCEYFKRLSHKLADTARSKIAASMEVAYRSLSLEAATRMLKLAGISETVAFLGYYNQFKKGGKKPSVIWRVEGGRINFVSEDAPRVTVSSKDMLINALKNIEELERIV